MLRRFLLLLPVSLVAQIQSSEPTNTPRCPVCRSASGDVLGHLVTSERADAVVPQVSPGKMMVCGNCGSVYAVV